MKKCKEGTSFMTKSIELNLPFPVAEGMGLPGTYQLQNVVTDQG